MGLEVAALATVAATAASVGGTIYAANQNNDAAEAQERANEREKTAREIENARKRRQAIAAQRRQVGAINNAGAISGATGSSGVGGAAGAVVSTTEGSLGYGASQENLRNQQLSFLESASESQRNASIGSTIAQIGTQAGGLDFSSYQGLLNKGNATQNGAATTASQPAGPPGRSSPYGGGYNSGVSFKQLG